MTHRACLPLLRVGSSVPGDASVVNITSVEAHRAGPGFGVYSAMKAGVENLTKTLTLELSADRIRVNSIAPDMIPTPGDSGLADDSGAMSATAWDMTPWPETGHVDDVAGAGAVIWLAGPMSRFVTGSTVHVDRRHTRPRRAGSVPSTAAPGCSDRPVTTYRRPVRSWGRQREPEERHMGESSKGVGPLAGVRIIECSMLGPAAITTSLADLGADVIKVEPPAGDYVRQMTWPIVEGTSLHAPARQPGQALASCSTCARDEGVGHLPRPRAATPTSSSRRCGPGGLAKRGLGYDEPARPSTPSIVFCTISGYGMTGPYKDMPSHGIAYDTWAGIVKPEHRRRRLHATSPSTRRSASTPDRCSARSAILAGSHPRPRDRRGLLPRDRPVRRRRRHRLVPHRDVEGLRAARGRGHRQQGRRLRAPGARHRRHARGRPLPDLRDRRRRTCCSWRPSRRSGRTSARASAASTCSSGGRARSTPTTPAGNRELRAELAGHLPARRRRRSGSSFGDEVNTPIAPVNTPETHRRRPAVPGPAALDSCRERARRRAAALPGQVRRRGAAPADEGARRSASTPTRCCATCSATTTTRSPSCAAPARSAPTASSRRRPPPRVALSVARNDRGNRVMAP